MKLYFSRGACSLGVRIIIHELDLPAEFESVNIKSKPKKTEKGEDFLKINPKGSVPVLLTDEGEILTENIAILIYLAEHSKETRLLPNEGNFLRYRVLEWLSFISADLHKAFGLLFNPATPQEIKENLVIPLIKDKLNFVDKSLQHKKFLLGENFTLPDAYLFVVLSWTFYFKINLEEWSNLNKYFNQLKERPSVQKSLSEENLFQTTLSS